MMALMYFDLFVYIRMEGKIDDINAEALFCPFSSSILFILLIWIDF